jgi:hypothetical protein
VRTAYVGNARHGCLIDERLEYHHIIGVAEWTGRAKLLGDPAYVAIVCQTRHVILTGEQQKRARSKWKLQPERHPALKW